MNSSLRNRLFKMAKYQQFFFIVVFIFVLFTSFITLRVFLADERKQLNHLMSQGNNQEMPDDYINQYYIRASEINKEYGKNVLSEKNTVFNETLNVFSLTEDTYSGVIKKYKQDVRSRKMDDSLLLQNGEASFQLNLSTSSKSSSTQDYSISKNTFSYRNHSSETNGEWQPVNGTKYKFYVYSAYYENRLGHFVRVIGATRTKDPDRIWCVFYYESQNKPAIVVPGAVQTIRENFGLNYTASFVICPLNSGNTLFDVPSKVSIVSHPDALITNFLNVHIHNFTDPPSNYSTEYKFSACIKPFHHDYNKVLELLEFLELNQLLGIQKFTFYNHTVGKEVSCVLKQYIQEGIVDVFPWELNMVSHQEIRTEGIFAALNDCLYRNMYKTKYLLMVDVDEYVIPQKKSTLNELLKTLPKTLITGPVGSYTFRNAFFYLQWPDDPKTITWPQLLTQRKTRRRSELHLHNTRSKYICLPQKIVEAGNHFVWESMPGVTRYLVPPRVGFSHHYRKCESGGEDCVNTSSVVDRTVHRYNSELFKKVKFRLEQLKDTCNLEKFVKEFENVDKT